MLNPLEVSPYYTSKSLHINNIRQQFWQIRGNCTDIYKYIGALIEDYLNGVYQTNQPIVFLHKKVKSKSKLIRDFLDMADFLAEELIKEEKTV